MNTPLTPSRFIRLSPDGREGGHITVNLGMERDGIFWVGFCEELGTAAYAETEDETWHQLREAVALQLSEMERLGVIDEYLRERGVRYDPSPSHETPDAWAPASVG